MKANVPLRVVNVLLSLYVDKAVLGAYLSLKSENITHQSFPQTGE